MLKTEALMCRSCSYQSGGFALSGMAALHMQQSRSFMGFFQKKEDAGAGAVDLSTLENVPEVVPAPFDFSVVDSIVDMATGPAADQMAWMTLYQGSWYHTYTAQVRTSLSQSTEQFI